VPKIAEIENQNQSVVGERKEGRAGQCSLFIRSRTLLNIGKNAESVKLILNRPIALAGGQFEAFPVSDKKFAARIINQPVAM